MKLSAIALMFVLPMMWTEGPPSHNATASDYREILRMLRGIDDSLDHLDALVSKDDRTECRELSPEKTVRCAAGEFHPPGGAEKAVAVWRCESGWGIERTTAGHIHHGPLQMLASTFLSQQAAIPDVVRWYELSADVHDPRSNILTGVAWSAKMNSWSPWAGCA